MTEHQDQSHLPTCLRPDLAKEWQEPLNVRDLATRLETEGVTDAVARSEFGYETAHSMAETWLPRVLTYGPTLEPPLAHKGLLREYVNGIAFSVPLLFSCLSMLTLGFALWGGELPNEDATAVGIGTVGSFLLAGGVVQAMVRRGLFFHTTQQPSMCASSIRHWFAVGVGIVGVGSLVLLAASEYWTWLPSRVNLVAAAFCVTLGIFWLAAGAFYVLEKGALLVWLNLAGIGVVWFLHAWCALPLITSQLLALAACCSAGTWIVLRFLRQIVGSAQSDVGAWDLAKEAYAVWPFFLYGITYYLLLFGDRLSAWTAQTYSAPLAVQFRGDYETAINIGLFTFVVLAGWVHCATAAFYTVIARSSKSHLVTEISAFRADVQRCYQKYALLLVALGVAAGLISFGVGTATGLLTGATTLQTAVASLIGYVLLMFGLWNVNLLFGLSSPVAAVRSAAIGCLANLCLGYLCSRVWGYEYAVIGFLAGGAVFAMASRASVLQAFQELDYRQFVVTG